jgi:hypothetical protein
MSSMPEDSSPPLKTTRGCCAVSRLDVYTRTSSALRISGDVQLDLMDFESAVISLAAVESGGGLLSESVARE